MRVLIPVHGFPPDSRYGAELYAFYLSRELRGLGASVRVLYPDRGTADLGDRVYGGLDCTVVGRPAASGPTQIDRPGAASEAAFRDLVGRFRPDVVHVNHLLHLSTRLPRIAQDAGCRVVFTLHDYWLRCPKVKLLDWWARRCTGASAWKCSSCCRARYSRMTWPSLASSREQESGPLKRLLKEACFQVAERPVAWRRLRQRQGEMAALVPSVDRFIAPSRFCRDLMAGWGIPRDRIALINYGTESLPYEARAGAIPGRRPRFGFLGGTTHEKGLHVILEAFRGQDWAELVVYGGCRDEALHRYGGLADQPNVEFGGRIDDEQKARLLPQVDALIVASIWHETGPIVIQEAFQAGVPVICSDLSPMAERVADDVDGLHFRTGDADDLRRVLARCARDPGLLERLRRGIARPKTMREHVRDEILPLYESLCGRGRATARGAIR